MLVCASYPLSVIARELPTCNAQTKQRMIAITPPPFVARYGWTCEQKAQRAIYRRWLLNGPRGCGLESVENEWILLYNFLLLYREILKVNISNIQVSVT
jgi:hypothetical protein